MSSDKPHGTRAGSTSRSGGLDHQYDLRAAFPDYIDFFEQWRARSEQARRNLNHRLDIAYGPGPRDHLDLFPAPHGAGRLLVFVHGGYWRFMDKADFSFVAVPYVGQGVSVALINYPLFPGTTMPTIVDKLCDACSWLAANAGRHGVRSSEFHLAGWSAGAHLATMVACCRYAGARTHRAVPDISTVLAISGVYDLQPLLQTSANADLQLDEAEARRNSPIHMRPRSKTRIAVVWGGEETEAFRRQSRAFAKNWQAKGVDLAPLEVPGAHHYAVMNELANESSSVFGISRNLLSVE